MSSEREFPFACVLLGCARTLTGASAAAEERKPGVRAIDLVVKVAVEAGADPVIAVTPPAVHVAPPVRVVTAPEGAGFATALRLGLSQLANSSATGTLIWPIELSDVELSTVLAVLDARKRAAAAVVVPAYAARPGFPCFLARDAWLEAMTLADGGPEAIFAQLSARLVQVPVQDPTILRSSVSSSSGSP